MATEPIESVLERVARLDREATKGPWRVGHPPPNGQQTIGSGGLMLAITTTYDQRDVPNAALIAAYRTDAVTLASEVVRLREALAVLLRYLSDAPQDDPTGHMLAKRVVTAALKGASRG